MDSPGLTFRDLEYIIAVDEHRHFGLAAESCHVSQPALSGQVRKVEDLLGVEIFVRGRKAITVTPRGAEVIAQARVLLEEGQKLLRIGRGSGAPLSGPFRLGAIATLGPYLLPHLIRPLRRSFPELQLQLREGLTQELTAHLKAGSLDAVLLSEPIEERGINTLTLFHEPFLLAVASDHPWSTRREVSLPELEQADDLLLLEEGHCLRDQLLEFCPSRRQRLARGHFHATSMETLRQMVASGGGVTLVPALAAQSDRRLGRLITYLPVAPQSPGRRIALALRSTFPRRGDAEALAAHIRRNLPSRVEPVS